MKNKEPLADADAWQQCTDCNIYRYDTRKYQRCFHCNRLFLEAKREAAWERKRDTIFDKHVKD